MLQKVNKVLGSVALVGATAVPSFAAISAADQTAILAGISGSDTLFYALGGGLLVVMAGIWGFKKVRAMF